ncbi:hypothetical protein ACJ73_05650, partial [Blastomyces percursus]
AYILPSTPDPPRLTFEAPAFVLPPNGKITASLSLQEQDAPLSQPGEEGGCVSRSASGTCDLWTLR